MAAAVPLGLAAVVIGLVCRARRRHVTQMLRELDRLPVDPVDIADIRQATAGVQGWLRPRAAERLYRLARVAPIPIVIELGSWRGLSTAWMARGLASRGDGRLYAIDTWAGTDADGHEPLVREAGGPDGLYHAFGQTLERARASDRVVPFRGTTTQASVDPRIPSACGLLYIDADHAYDAVLQDYLSWAPRVVPNGFLVMDDVPLWSGPTRVAHAFAARDFDFVGQVNHQWIGRRRETAPAMSFSSS